MKKLTETKINPLGIKFLEKIDPIPEIVESLNDIIHHNNYDKCQFPKIEIGDFLSKKADTYRVAITVLRPSSTVSDISFRFRINSCNPRKTVEGEDARECVLASKFLQLFDKVPSSCSKVLVTCDVVSISRLATYILSIFGLNSDSDLYIKRFITFKSGNPIKLNTSEFVFPDVYRRAIDRACPLNLTSDDKVQLILTSSDAYANSETLTSQINGVDLIGFSILYRQQFLTRSDVYHRLSFRYSDAFKFYGNKNSWFSLKEKGVYEAERYIVPWWRNELKEIQIYFDYFFFLNPHLRIEDTVISLDFRNCVTNQANFTEGAANQDLSDYIFSFYPDGREDSPEKFDKCIKALEGYRTARPPKRIRIFDGPIMATIGKLFLDHDDDEPQ